MIDNTLSISSTLYDAIKSIEATDKRLAVVLSSDKSVIGTLTDGDIRRYILSNNSLEDKVSNAMNSNPVIAKVNSSDSELRKILVKNNIRSVPLVNHKNKYIRILHENELLDDDTKSFKENFSTAVIMAGGEGRRLRPLTKDMPKPMVDINGIPLLERQIRKLSKMGINNIYISINYLGNVIQEYFNDGKKFGTNITYLKEIKKLGTAGALALLPDFDQEQTILVMNGDILTTSDFINLFHFHKDQGSSITMSAIDYHIDIPFGVIKQNSSKVESIEEKPSQHFFCNAGIYALTSKILKKIPSNNFFNMTDLIDKCLQEEDVVSVFPVYEYWSDIGTVEDLNKARKIYKS